MIEISNKIKKDFDNLLSVNKRIYEVGENFRKTLNVRSTIYSFSEEFCVSGEIIEDYLSFAVKKGVKSILRRVKEIEKIIADFEYQQNKIYYLGNEASVMNEIMNKVERYIAQLPTYEVFNFCYKEVILEEDLKNAITEITSKPFSKNKKEICMVNEIYYLQDYIIESNDLFLDIDTDFEKLFFNLVRDKQKFQKLIKEGGCKKVLSELHPYTILEVCARDVYADEILEQPQYKLEFERFLSENSDKYEREKLQEIFCSWYDINPYRIYYVYIPY